MARLDGARYSDESVTLSFGLGVKNDNAFALELGELRYVVRVAGKEMATGVQGRRDTVSSGATGIYEEEVTLDLASYGPQVKPLIQSGAVPYEVTGSMKVATGEVPFTLAGNVTLGHSR